MTVCLYSLLHCEEACAFVSLALVCLTCLYQQLPRPEFGILSFNGEVLELPFQVKRCAPTTGYLFIFLPKLKDPVCVDLMRIDCSFNDVNRPHSCMNNYSSFSCKITSFHSILAVKGMVHTSPHLFTHAFFHGLHPQRNIMPRSILGISRASPKQDSNRTKQKQEIKSKNPNAPIH